MSINIRELSSLVELGMIMREIANEKIKVFHPIYKSKKTIEEVEIYEDLKNQEVNAKNLIIFGKGQLDRSPCGTGTCAKMATLYAKGLLDLNIEYIHEGILGTSFKGRLISETKVGKFSAVIPEITGRAWITGLNQIIVDPGDPFAKGFFLS